MVFPSLVPGAEGEERAPGINCTRMRVIIKLDHVEIEWACARMTFLK